jgi:hypothetical protein
MRKEYADGNLFKVGTSSGYVSHAEKLIDFPADVPDHFASGGRVQVRGNAERLMGSQLASAMRGQGESPAGRSTKSSE